MRNLPIIIFVIIISSLTSFLVTHYSLPKNEPVIQSLKPIEGQKVRLLNSPIGGFFFAVNNKEKVEKGYKFDFALGNRNYAEFEGVKIRISWGKKPIEKDQKPDLKSTNIAIDKIEVGKWKNFSLVIPVTDEKDLEIVALTILGANKISLFDSEK
jgi:hypothetical protein